LILFASGYRYFSPDVCDELNLASPIVCQPSSLTSVAAPVSMNQKITPSLELAPTEGVGSKLIERDWNSEV
jgi:hypothetical protein